MRSLRILPLLFVFSFMLPHGSPANPQGTVPGDVMLFMFKTGTGSERTGVNNIYASLGETISIDVFIKNYSQVPISAIEVYLTVDSKYFSVAGQGVNAEENKYKGQIKPFIQGQYLKNAYGSIPPYGNNMAGDKQSDMDNGRPGWQLNYVVITGPDVGSGRPVSKLLYGVVCTFKLTALAPCDSVKLLLDADTYNMRVSQYYNPYTSDSFSFRYNFPTYITVSGITIFPPIPDLRLVSGTSDSTLDLDDHVGLSSIPDSLLHWSAKGFKNIAVSIDSLAHVVTFTAPSGFKGSEDVIFTVDNGKGVSASDTMRVTVGMPPKLIRSAIPDTLVIHEDTLEPALDLKNTAEDSDDPFMNLKWTFRPKAGKVTASVVSDTLFLKGIQDFNGLESLGITVSDPLGASDSLAVPVRVLSVNDPPVLKKLPDITMSRNQTRKLDIGAYASDVDSAPLTVTWKASDHLSISKDGMLVTLASAGGFIGSEGVVFSVTDPGGLSAVDSLRVTVTPATVPPVWSKIPKIGFPQNRVDSTLVLWNYVSDADDPKSDLTFVLANLDNVDSVYVNPRTGRATFYDLDNAPGWDRVTVTAFDPDGNHASIQFSVFIGPADGTPIVAGVPDTTIVTGSQVSWIDLDDYYYDADNTDSQMKWSWGRQASADSSVTVSINLFTHVVLLRGLSSEKFGVNRLFFTVTDPYGKFGDDICIVSAVGLNRPVLDLPKKVGFVVGTKYLFNLDDFVQDEVYEKKDLTWFWTGNMNTAIVYETPDAVQTRPVSFSGAASWKGWEQVAFEVKNPLGGAAHDTLLVFSVPSDGSPVAGGLKGILLKAGTCTQVNLDDYYFDADSADFQLTWTAVEGDSVKVSIDPLTRIATVCAPSDTWEGQNTITFAVADQDNHSGSMQVTVTVTDAVIRNAFSVMLFRNPMQEDYMDVYVKSEVDLQAKPSVYVRTGKDSTTVKLDSLDPNYFAGQYLLPLNLSLGQKGTATVNVHGVTKAGKEVSSAMSFGYGRIDRAGGKIALDSVALDIPEGALEQSALITVTPHQADAGSAAKEAPNEVVFEGEEYRIGPASLKTLKPMVVEFRRDGDTRGAGVYHFVGGIPVFLGGLSSNGLVMAEIRDAGAYRLGFDRTPPRIGRPETCDGVVTISLDDRGSGVDECSLRVTRGSTEVAWRFDPASSAIVIDQSRGYKDYDEPMEITVADRSGNTATERIVLDAAVAPFRLTVAQNTPNPFNPRTLIPFTVTRECKVTIEIFDLTGRRVTILAEGAFPAGTHALSWDARDDRGRMVSSGTYFYRVTAGANSVARKMLFLR